MATLVSKADGYKTPAAVDTWETLGPRTLLLSQLTFIGQKADGTNNTAVAWARLASGAGVKWPIYAGSVLAWDQSGAGIGIRAHTVEVQITSAGDSIGYIYNTSAIHEGL